jgi:cytochrome oxidase Cu insertion factor (SCO1/SenC/PrrC family)
MRSILDNKKGQLGMDVAKSFMLGLMTLLVIGVTVLIVLNSLGDTSVVLDDNDTTNVISNGSEGLTDFFENTTTWLALLGVVIIILIISVVISVVNRFGGGRTTF